MMNKLRSLLTTTNVPAWLIAAGFVGSLLLNSFATYLITQAGDQQQVVREAKVSDVNEFLKASEEFEALTRVFMTKVVDKNAVDPAAREALLANIQRQHIMLDNANAYLTTDQRAVTTQYQRDLVALSARLQEASDIPTTAPVWRQMNDTLLHRRTVVAELRRAAGLPTNSQPNAA